MSILSGLKRFFLLPGAWKLLVAMLLYGCSLGILNPMNAIYLKEGIGLTKFEISALVSITLLVNMTVTFISGLLSDKMRNRKMIPVVASAISICGLAGYNQAHGFLSALAFYILSTAPSGAVVGQLYAMARSHFAAEAPDIVDMGIVWLRTLLSVGFFSGLYLGAALYTVVTFHGVIVGNLICYVGMFCMFVFYRERQAPVSASKIHQGMGIQWMILTAILLLLCCDAIRGLYFPLMVESLFHNPILVSRLWSVQVICEFLWMTVAGVASKKYGDVQIVSVGGSCALLAYLVYAIHPSLPWLFAVQPIHSFFVSVLGTVAMGIIQRMFMHRAGFGSSLYFVLSQSASLIGYMVPNLIPGLTPHIFFLPAALMIASIGMLLVKLVMNARLKVTFNVSA